MSSLLKILCRISVVGGRHYGPMIRPPCCRRIDAANFHSSYQLQKRRKTSEERKAAKIIQYSPKAKIKLDVIGVWKNMTVAELASAMKKNTDHVFEVMLYVDKTDAYSEEHSPIDDLQIIQQIVKMSGMKAQILANPCLIKPKHNKEEVLDAVPQPPAPDNDLKPRPPVVTVMGHVDHGKTTLLDALRETHVAESEAGGITQHIGAFSVHAGGGTVTFLDTPGHAAFRAMRSRGAHATDIVVLAVAADDGVMEQTIESVRMAEDAGVPMVIAITKIDKPNADPSSTMRALAQHGLQVEALGGDVQAVEVSAKQHRGLDKLVEAVWTLAELQGVKSTPVGKVEGVVIESMLDPARGRLATVLVRRGTMRRGCVLVAGTAWAKVRSMLDAEGCPLTEAPPSTPTQVLGWRELPSAGDIVLEVDGEKRAHDIMKLRHSKQMEKKALKDAEIIDVKRKEERAAYITQLEKRRMMGRFKLKPDGPRKKEIQEDTGPAVRVVLKGDADGSVEALLDVLATYDEQSICRLDIVHYGVGPVTETDVELASAFGANIYTFSVGCPPNVEDIAKHARVTIKEHDIIYRLIDELKEEISNSLPTVQVERVLGEASVMQQFLINEGRKKIPVAGCRCVNGRLEKRACFRVRRGDNEIFDGSLRSMRHLKNEVESVKKDVECGLQLTDSNVAFEPGDVIVCYELIEEPQQSKWDPGF